MRIKTILLYTGVIVILLVGGLFGAYKYFFGTLTQDTSFQEAVHNASESLSVTTYEEQSLEDANIKNIAIFGIDSKTSDNGRSDATMILSIDYEHNKIKLCSIARDTLVYIPEKDVYEKFTHAYAYGGATLAVKTLNTNFNLNITDYVAVNFSEMAGIVDMLGGVEVDLSAAEIPYIGENASTSGLYAGENVTLNGEQAVSYSRIRHLDSDNVRASRQREVMNSIFEKARNMSATQYPGLIREGLSMCTTSLDYSEIFGFSKILLSDNLTLEQEALPGDDIDAWGGIMSSSGAWCYVYDLREASNKLLTFIYEDIYTNSGMDLPEATVDKSFVN
ncbi:MAG: LCP family protein [Eubacteriales bacterium]|nr:LCP family protein [Eubacteriales bacterium]